MASFPSSIRLRRAGSANGDAERSPNEFRLDTSSVPFVAHRRPINHYHLNLYSLLAIAQRNRLDFMPIQWETGDSALLGLGATGRVDQACIDIRTSLAFKRFKRRRPPAVHSAERSGDDEDDDHELKGKVKDNNEDSELFLAWSMEIAVLRSPTIAGHPGIIDLEGLAWDIHPGESGKSASVLPALVYKKADLGTLLMFLETRASRLTLAEKLAICLDMSIALATVHSCGVIHGDLKPANIVVFTSPESVAGVTPKIIDFSYSCLGLRDDEPVCVSGTALWWPPELAGPLMTMAEAKRLDAYALALVLFVVLGYDAVRASNLEIFHGISSTSHRISRLVEHLKGNPSDGFIQQILSLDTSTPPEQHVSLTALFKRALSRDRNGRFSRVVDIVLELISIHESARFPAIFHVPQTEIPVNADISLCEFKEVLDAIADLELADFRVRRSVIQALRDTMDSSQCSDCRSHAAFQLALCERVGLADLRGEHVSDALERSGRAENDLTAEISLFQQAKKSQLSNRLQKLVGGYSLDFSETYQRDGCLLEAVYDCDAQIQKRLAIVPPDHASPLRLRYQLGELYGSLRRWKEAENEFANVLKERERIYGVSSHSTLICRAKVGICLARQGRIDQGIQLLQATWSLMKEALGEDHKSSVAIMGHIASVLAEQGSFEEADVMLAQQLELSSRISGEDHINTLSIVHHLGVSKFRVGDWKGAEELISRALEIKTNILGPDDREVLTGLGWLCQVYMEQGRHEDARKLQQREIDIYKRLGLDRSLGAIYARGSMGLILSGLGELDQACRLTQSAAVDLEGWLGEAHPDVLAMWSDVSMMKLEKAEWHEALEIQEEVIRKATTARERNKPHMPGFLHGLANIYQKLSRFEDAKIRYLTAEEESEAIFGKFHPRTVKIRTSLANAHKSLGDLELAEQIEEEVCESLKMSLGEGHATRLVALRNLSITYRNLDKLGKALEIQDEIDLQRGKHGDLRGQDQLGDIVNRSAIYSSQGRLAEALALQQGAETSLTRAYGLDNAGTLDCRSHLAQTLEKLKQYSTAEAILREDLPRHVRLFGEQHEHTLFCRMQLAVVLSRQGKWPESEAEYTEISQACVRAGWTQRRVALQAQIGIALSKYEQQEYQEGFGMIMQLKRQEALGKHQDLFSQADDVMYLLIGGLLGPAALERLALMDNEEAPA